MASLNKTRNIKEKIIEKRKPIHVYEYTEEFKNEEIKYHLSLILNDSIMEKVWVSHGKNITIDLHGLKVKEAKCLINNIINIIKDDFSLKLIHGYHNGVALKNMINSQFINTRIIKVEPSEQNPGETKLFCKSVN